MVFFLFPDTREGNKASCGWKGGYLKQKKCVFFIVSILLSLILSIQVYAVGDGNLDGGGGSMDRGPVRIPGHREMKGCGLLSFGQRAMIR